jgi:hypothetical protein
MDGFLVRDFGEPGFPYRYSRFTEVLGDLKPEIEFAIVLIGIFSHKKILKEPSLSGGLERIYPIRCWCRSGPRR